MRKFTTLQLAKARYLRQEYAATGRLEATRAIDEMCDIFDIDLTASLAPRRSIGRDIHRDAPTGAIVEMAGPK